MRCVVIKTKLGKKTIPFADYDPNTMNSSGIVFEIEEKAEEVPVPEEMPIVTLQETNLVCECGKECASALGLNSHQRACRK